LLDDKTKKSAEKPSGGYNFRFIKNTKRLSIHSFGAAFDLNPSVGEYCFFDLEKSGKAKCCKKPPQPPNHRDI